MRSRWLRPGGVSLCGQGKLGFIGVPVIILLVVFAIAQLGATRTRVGHYIAAVGDNPMAAFYSGIDVYRSIIVAFVLSAFMSGIAGVILTSISSSAQPVGGEGYLLEAFAAVSWAPPFSARDSAPARHADWRVLLFMVNSGMNMVGFRLRATISSRGSCSSRRSAQTLPSIAKKSTSSSSEAMMNDATLVELGALLKIRRHEGT